MFEKQVDLADIRERLDLMESALRRTDRALRRWRLTALAGLSLAVVVVAAGALAEPAKELSVRTLRLVDRGGKERIVLTAEEGIPDMTFLDPAGKGRLTLDITEDRVPVLLFSESGEQKNGMSLGIGEEEGPMLQFFDIKGKKRIMLAAPPKGKPYLRFQDEAGKLLARFP
jgi:hypothetical protein